MLSGLRIIDAVNSIEAVALIDDLVFAGKVVRQFLFRSSFLRLPLSLEFEPHQDIGKQQTAVRKAGGFVCDVSFQGDIVAVAEPVNGPQKEPPLLGSTGIRQDCIHDIAEVIQGEQGAVDQLPLVFEGQLLQLLHGQGDLPEAGVELYFSVARQQADQPMKDSHGFFVRIENVQLPRSRLYVGHIEYKGSSLLISICTGGGGLFGLRAAGCSRCAILETELRYQLEEGEIKGIYRLFSHCVIMQKSCGIPPDFQEELLIGVLPVIALYIQLLDDLLILFQDALETCPV